MVENPRELSEDLDSIEYLLRYAGLSKKYIVRVQSAYAILRTGDKLQKRIFDRIFHLESDK